MQFALARLLADVAHHHAPLWFCIGPEDTAARGTEQADAPRLLRREGVRVEHGAGVVHDADG